MSLVSKARALLGIRPKEPPLISVVLYFRRHVPLTDDIVHTAIVQAWGQDVQADRNEHVVNKPPICLVRFDGMMLLLSNVGKPYCAPQDLEQALAEFPEMRQKKVVREHNAFLTIDLMHPKDPNRAEKKKCYGCMSKLAAELIDDNCVGVYFPETGHLRPYDTGVVSALRSELPLREIQKWGEPPVMPIEDDDPRLVRAVAEARRRWPEFVWAFEHRQEGQSFSVKCSFSDGDNKEWMWVMVTSIRDNMIEGFLGNAPVDVRNIREGDPTTVRASDIGDWAYSDGASLTGGFTLNPLVD